MIMNYWLFKSEPDEYSIDDLKNEPNSIGCWDGVRNYQARNLIRDQVTKGDLVLFYHSSCKNTGIAGVAEVVSAPFADPTQFDVNVSGYDKTATADTPKWFSVDILYKRHAIPFITTAELKKVPSLTDLILFKQPRLSIQPITAEQWLTIMKMLD